MPSMNIDFTDQEYAEIPAPWPGKKRGWVRELVRRELQVLRQAATTLVETPVDAGQGDYVFWVNGKVYIGKGDTPAKAAEALGLKIDATTDWLPLEQAREEGWLDVKVEEV